MKVLLGPSSFAALDKTPLLRLIEAGIEVVENPYKRKLTKQELMELLPGVTGLIAGLETIDREVLEKSDLKVISRCGSGISNVDLKAAKDFGIKVYTTPDAPVTAVAELTVGSMLCLLRSVSLTDSDLHQGRWSKRIGLQLQGKTVVIIGFGRIGRCVAKMLGPFNVEILVVDPNIENDHLEFKNITILSLEDALPKADIITLHLSGDQEILGEKEFKLIKKGAFLLNAARGGLINESVLCMALKTGYIAGAWLDCFREEPYTGELTQFPQVILTPHVGSYTVECRSQMEMEAVGNLIQGFSVK